MLRERYVVEVDHIAANSIETRVAGMEGHLPNGHMGELFLEEIIFELLDRCVPSLGP
jgi:hypothetical protein